MTRARSGLITLLLLALIGLGSALGIDYERLRDTFLARHGQTQLALFDEWRNMMLNTGAAGERDKVRLVNDFFNGRIGFDDDYSIWGQKDYWATPMEMMAQRGGDCEDFSIAKYFSLLELGVPVNKLRLVYVRATLPMVGGGGSMQQAHMVLAYYPRPNADPLVLDNLNKQILPASQRHDLSPVFSFNSAGLWQGTGNQSSRSNLSRWQDLLARARAEGFQ